MSMNLSRPSARTVTRPGQRGFTMIEVLITLVVLAVGLLGLAMLQTMNLRFTQSANQRTQATNLAYEMLDQMRANRVLASAYLGEYKARDKECDLPIGTVTSAAFNKAWECRLNKALGADATATITQDGKKMKVAISWNDERWVKGAKNPKFEADTEL